jgi:hypothetical protein
MIPASHLTGPQDHGGMVEALEAGRRQKKGLPKQPLFRS